MSELPTGTVTFLYTDIQGSTELAQKYPDAMQRLLMRHHAILREAIETHRGVVFRIAGDSFSAAFDTAADALNAAIRAQQKLNAVDWQPAPLRVRMGINTGEARAKGIGSLDGEYEGYSTLARVARVMALAHGGQILLSNSTAELVRDALPETISLRDIGEHKLKGFISVERLWQVVAPDLPQDFPPLQTLDTVPSNLPAALSRLVGRSMELQEIKQRLAQTRLLTLLGPGGAGKTRLALQAASDLRGEFQDQVYFVDLVASRDAESALAAIGRAVGLREKNDGFLLDDLKSQIGNRKMLSLLDNFEQVTVAAPTMAELLRDCPELKMLVTSREALHVRGETVFPVPPLSLPQIENRNPSLEKIQQCEAVQLFIARAQAVKPDFQLTQENARAVAEICVRLDGLPLAIELATARLNVFTPQVLAERLNNRLKILRGGARDLPARQQTLRDTIDWSYEMLRADEQQLFALLSVFAGATFEAIETVAGRMDSFADADIFEIVGSLADKSLIRQLETPDGTLRLQMLETIREFAAAQLTQNEALHAAAQRAHAEYFAAFAQSQWALLNGDKRDAALSHLTTDLENIEAAWQYWVSVRDLEQLGKLTDSLWLLYDARGWYHSSVKLTKDLLQVLGTTVSTPERARQEILLQTALARMLTTTKGFTKEVEEAYKRALALSENVGEIPQMFPVLRGLSYHYVYRTEFAKARQMGERMLNLANQLDDPNIKMEALMVIGYNVSFLGEIERGMALLEESIAAYDFNRQRVRRLGMGANPGIVSLVALGFLSWMAGYPERGLERLGQSVALGRKLEHPFSLAYAMFHYALLNLWSGNFKVARERARALLEIADEHEFVIWSAVGRCLRGTSMSILGAPAEGLNMIEQAMVTARGQNTPPIFFPSLLHLNASSLALAGKPKEGLQLLEQAIEIATAGDGHLQDAEFLSAKGDLLLAIDPNNAAEAEKCYQRALDSAREFRVHMLELRAAIKLGRLWQQQGKRAQARELLEHAYAKMTEGFELYDLLQARTLLQELASP